MPRGVSRARGGRTLAGCGGMGASSAREDGLHEGRAGIAGRRGVQMIASRERAGGGRRAAGGDGVERAWCGCGDDEKLSMRTRSLVLLAACLPLIAAAPDWAPRPDDSGQHAHTRTPERCWQLLSWSLAAPSRRVTPCSLLVSAKGRYSSPAPALSTADAACSCSAPAVFQRRPLPQALLRLRLRLRLILMIDPDPDCSTRDQHGAGAMVHHVHPFSAD